jgi:transposase
MGNRFKRQAKKQRDRIKQKRQRLLQVKAAAKDGTPPPEGSPEDSAQRTQVSIDELEAILARAERGPLSESDRQLLLSALRTLRFLTAQLEKKSISVSRLKKLLFGAATETSSNLGLDGSVPDETDASSDENTQDCPSDESSTEAKPKRQGHGRNGADAYTYTGVQKVHVPHETLKAGDPCPRCEKGTVYETAEPGKIVCVTGRPPLAATVYELQKLRCNLCGKIYTAQALEAAGDEKKYDAEAGSMVAQLKYGTGMPFNRLAGLQGTLGIPLPASTQWESNRAAHRCTRP